MSHMTAMHGEVAHHEEARAAGGLDRFLSPVARLLLSAVFLEAAPAHFRASTVHYAALHGVPFPHVLVPLSGAIALAGGLSVLLGWRARAGAWLLVLFLVPVTLFMHDFWNLRDPMASALQRVMFLKNLGLLGGALLVARMGAGPISLDAERDRARGKAQAH